MLICKWRWLGSLHSSAPSLRPCLRSLRPLPTSRARLLQGPECCKEVKKPSIASFFQSKRPSAAAGGTGAAGSAAAAVAAAAAGGSPTGGSRQQGPKQEHGEEQEGSPAAKQEVAGAAEALNADQNPQPSPTGTAGTAAAVTTPSSGQKRKQPPSGSKGSGGSASKKAKERPAGQPDIARFFSKG